MITKCSAMQELDFLRDRQYLLSYRLMGNDIELIMIGPHENYYRNLKKYLKKG
jgi:hypothetical protein